VLFLLNGLQKMAIVDIIQAAESPKVNREVRLPVLPPSVPVSAVAIIQESKRLGALFPHRRASLIMGRAAPGSRWRPSEPTAGAPAAIVPPHCRAFGSPFLP
jgi:hypothetical protein